MSKAKKSPKGPKIIVCIGVHCRQAGAEKLYQELEVLIEQSGGEIRLKTEDCLDACGAAPVLELNPGRDLCPYVSREALPGIIQKAKGLLIERG